MIAALLLVARPAFAENKRVEAAGKAALKRAEDDYLRSEFDRGRKRLQAAERACGERGCTPATLAAIVRDIGVMQLRLGSRDTALASFRRAKRIDPNVAINPSYDAQDLREAWAETVPIVQPAGGDFTHKPAAAIATRHPLPVYVEPATAEPIATVVVRYRSETTKSYRRAPLQKRGQGWGGYVPCADVVPERVQYYIQGFDKDGELVGTSGSPEQPFVVPVRAEVAEEPAPLPLLPGERPPRACGDEQLETLNLSEGERCQEDRQCKSGVCSDGVCHAPAEEPDDRPRGYARVWIGVSGALVIGVPPAQNDACKLNGTITTTSYWCTTPEGGNFPETSSANAALLAGRSGNTTSDLTTGGVHVTGTLDYALGPSLLVGVRFGYVLGAYPATLAPNSGKTLGTPFHLEVRGTYLLGDEPLTRSGLAPFVFASVGAARFDFGQTVQIGQAKVAGDRPVEAWLVAGPAFAEVGGGARYAFSQRIAASTGLGVTAAIGPAAFALAVAPEVALQYGF